MKKLAFFFAMLSIAWTGVAQTTGSGVVLQTDSPYAFTPTTVDSTAVFEVELTNTVGVAQTVYFGGLEAPFSIDPSTPQEVPANSSINLTISFNPTEIGSFEDELEVLGDVFGSANLALSGQGIQVILDWTPTDLSFETTAIGQQSSATVTVTSSGDGAGTISDVVFSNSIFSLDLVNSTVDVNGPQLSIDEGTSGDLTFLFSPTGAGVFNETVELYTNDPNNSVITIPLTATGISEVSGEVCDVTWSLADSPFTLVGDVTVPEGCSLTIEPGVVVNGSQFTINVNGQLDANGTASDIIALTDLELRADSGELDLSFSELSGFWSQTLFQNYGPDQNDVYLNDFESYNTGENNLFSCQNTYSGSNYGTGSTSGNNGCSSMLVYDSESFSHSGSKSFEFFSDNYSADLYYDETIVADESGEFHLSFGLKTATRDRNTTFLAYYSVNGGDWQEFYEGAVGDYEAYGSSYPSQLDHIIGVDLSLDAGDEISLKFRNEMRTETTSSCYDTQYNYIDDIRLARGSRNILYTTDGNWTESEFYDDGWSLDWNNQYSASVSFNSEYVSLYTQGYEGGGYDEYIQSPVFTANETGMVQFEWQEFVPGSYYQWRERVEVSINGGDYTDVYFRDLANCQNYLEHDYAEWNNRIATLGFLEQGDTFELRLNPFQNQGNSWGHTVYYKDLEIFTIRYPKYGGLVAQNSSLTIHSCTTPRLTLTGGNEMNALSDINATELSFLQTVQDGSLGSPLILESSQIGEFSANGISSIAFSQLESVTVVNGGLSLINSEVMNSAGTGVNLSGASVGLTMVHSKVQNHGGHGVAIDAASGEVLIENSIISNNGGSGIKSTLNGYLKYSTIADNAGSGWERDFVESIEYDTNGNCVNDADGDNVCDEVDDFVGYWDGQQWICTNDSDFDGICDEDESGESVIVPTIIENSILCNNGYSADNSVVEPSAMVTYSYFDNYPQFQEGSYMLEAYSPCVDAAMPWNTDQNMPYGMGGLRADIGAYGGPNNAGWGGSPAPDGAATLQAASDTPQDQGYVLGLTFDASAFDNSVIPDNVDHYAVWRHYDPTGESIASLDDGNWELLGTMPAQGFSGYAYQAEALGNTNDFGTFTSCYSVVAHTDDEDVYWYSNVMCGEAVDNLAPEDPDLNGLVLETGEAQLSWPTPAEEDYAYTEIFSDAGFSAEVGADTLVVDNTVLAGNSYTYTAVHYDVNGNASDAVSLTLDISAGLDVINLNAGWNLISIDRSLSDGDIETLFSGLQSNNLQYVTGFQNGVQFYDPNGLSFLNTMSSVDNGYGYWVKVAEDDVLEVGGSSLPVNYRPELNAGWNLIGYPNAEDSDPADYFADLIADDNLVYVTGFDEGSQVFDPNGLSFLNTLQELENGFGYWVKTLVGEDLNGLSTSDTKRNPSYMVLNGLSSLTAAGETVDVLNASGGVIAQMEILEGGFLMTTAVFGADPSDANAFGLELGETLSFAFNGRLADQTIEWQGGMEHRALNLTFGDAAEALTLAPNPAQDQTWLTFQLDRDAAVSVQVTDALGRVVMQQPLGTLTQGDQQHALSLLGMAPGVYEVAVMSDGSVAATARLLMQK